MKVLLLGSSGLLGATLRRVLRSNAWEVYEHGSDTDNHANFTNSEEAWAVLDKVNPDLIVNLIGLTNVDLCELEPNKAYLVNVNTVENIVSWMEKNTSKCHLIQISTDQVYDGEGPHLEAKAALTNYYAFSKYAGELVALRVSSTILRVNFFGYSHCYKRTSFSDWIYNSLSKKESIQVFDNVLFSPLSMLTLSDMIELSMKERPDGIFNLGSHLGLSKADFVFLFANKMGLSTLNIKRTTTKKVTFLKTYRPNDMRMDCSKFEKKLNIQLPELVDEIDKVIIEYKKYN